MFNDAAEKNKQGANTNTSASANFSVSSLFSLTSSDAAVNDVPDVTGDALSFLTRLTVQLRQV